MLVTIDTLRADHLGSYGYLRPTSPFIDSLALDGVLFENALSATSHTAPSHATMFTSLNPESHAVQVNGTALPEGIDTLAAALGRAGFESAAFTSVTFLKLIGSGFDHFDAARDHAGAVVDRAIDWLERPRSDAPVFLWIHLYDAHQYQISQGPHKAFTPRIQDSMKDRPGVFDRYIKKTNALDRVKSGLRKRLLSYDSRIAYVDAEIERLFDSEAIQALDGETLWVITADHGEGLGSHGYLGHGRHLYREQLRVPLILYPVPAVRAGRPGA